MSKPKLPDGMNPIEKPIVEHYDPKCPANQYWSMTEGVFNCLIDKRRTKAFAKAIKATVRPGDIVVDMGAGSGVLSMLAIKAGASLVYAIEHDENNIRTLRSVFTANGCMSRIKIIGGDATKIELPEKIDVICGEMVATALIEELQIPAMNNMLRFAKKSTRIVLSKYNTSVDLVYNNAEFYGFCFDIFRYEYPEEKSLASKPFTTKHMLVSHNLSKSIDDLWVNESVLLRVKKSGKINGIRLSGQSVFHDGSKLGATPAYSYPLILPVEERSVESGEILSLSIKYKLSGGLASLRYQLQAPSAKRQAPSAKRQAPKMKRDHRHQGKLSVED